MIFIVIGIQWVIYIYNVAIPEAGDNWWGNTVLFTVSSCVIVYLFALNKGKVSTLLTNRILLFIGNISASAFLIHQMIYRYLSYFEKIFHIEINIYFSFVLCFVITVICAILWDQVMGLIKKLKWMQ